MQFVFLLCLVEFTVGQAAPSHESNEKGDFQELIALVRKHGGTVSPSIGLSDNGTVRGLVATQEVAAGKVLLSVPPKLVLSASVATQRNPGCAVQSLLDECDSGRGKTADCSSLLSVAGNSPAVEKRVLELAAFLVARMHSPHGAPEDDDLPCQTFALPPHLFDPWLKLLPASDSEELASLPVFAVHDSQCANVLNGTKIEEIARQQRTEWAQQWEVLARRVPSLGRRSVGDFFHAKALIMTRAYSTHMTKGVPVEPVMIPLADMFNMDVNRDQAGLLWDNFNVPAKGFRVLSDHPLADGSQLLETYGDRTNLDLYRTYGFFFEQQPMEPVPLELPMFADKSLEKDGQPRVLQLQLSSSLHAQSSTLLAFARKIIGAGATNESQAQNAESAALRFLHSHIESEIVSRFGQASLSAIKEPLALSSSTSSSSCSRYKRLLLEPYGALMDFIELADTELEKGAPSQLAKRDFSSPQRIAFATQLLQDWRQQQVSISRKTQLRKVGVKGRALI